MIPRYFVVAEAEHELQNPTSEEKLVLLGKRLGLGPGSRVLDIASGRGGPAVLRAREFGCAVHGIERHQRWKRTYLRHGRDLIGWAILVGWKPST